MIIHKLIAHHLKHHDDAYFYLVQAQDAIRWIEESGVSLGAGTQALDLGCGHGVFGAELMKRGCQVTFADEVKSLLARWGVSRQIYVAETDARALAEAKDAELWYQESFRRFVVPDRIEEAHPSLQPAFLAMAERLSKITWEGLVAETLAFGSPDTVARHIEVMRDMGVGQVMCWMNFGGLAQDKVRRSMELFAREVMPRFR